MLCISQCIIIACAINIRFKIACTFNLRAYASNTRKKLFVLLAVLYALVIQYTPNVPKM